MNEFEKYATKHMGINSMHKMILILYVEYSVEH